MTKESETFLLKLVFNWNSFLWSKNLLLCSKILDVEIWHWWKMFVVISQFVIHDWNRMAEGDIVLKKLNLTNLYAILLVYSFTVGRDYIKYLDKYFRFIFNSNCLLIKYKPEHWWNPDTECLQTPNKIYNQFWSNLGTLACLEHHKLEDFHRGQVCQPNN